ncbi:uncharacterized protein LOC135491331 isoform X2 [Lineus longissimus]|uniref:uncharacterized protein LOC135491331 isoform X2 n=1 Tax=Lineus longissimus TaxID=88925 RepID=UPI00315D990D
MIVDMACMVEEEKEEGPPMNKPKIAHSFDDKRRTDDILIGENLDFAGLFLSPSVLQGLSEAGFRNPSPIQLKAIPLGRCGLDLIVQAKSGTGKTCVFTVIALEGLLVESCSVQVLVLAPTREIALQIQDVILTIGQKVMGLMCHSFIGGLPLSQDKECVKKCHIAVGTPGRVKQLIEESILTTDSIRLFVLDEADKLLEDGFQEQINWIYSTLPDNKQMVALSATYPEYLANHLTAYMRNPTFVRLNTLDPALLGIKQFYQELPFQPLAQKAFEEKSKSLIALLSSITFQQCLVFSNLQVAAENLSDLLNSKGWPSAFIAGSQDQKLRMKAMEKLKKYECRVLISTDLTSRGIDADKIDLVVNLDLPLDHETYLHRIGRAGRFGAYGAAVSLVVKGKESTRLQDIQEKCHTVIKPLPDPISLNLTQPVGHVCLDDMVTTEQLITVPKDKSKREQTSEKHTKVQLVTGPTDGRMNGDAVLVITTEKKTNEHIVRQAENGSAVDGGEVINGETNRVENVDLRKQTTGTENVESSVESSMNRHHKIVEGDFRSENDSALLRKEADSVTLNGRETLKEIVDRRDELVLFPNNSEAWYSTAQTGVEARVADGVAFEKLMSISDNEDMTSNKMTEHSVKDEDVTVESGLADGKEDQITTKRKSNGLSQNGDRVDKKKKSGKKETGKTVAHSSRELRSYCDLDFDMSEQVEIPEFGVGSSVFGACSTKSGARSTKSSAHSTKSSARSSKFSDQFAWSKPAAQSSKSATKVSKSGVPISDKTVSKHLSGNQASLFGSKPARQETVDKLSRLEEKLGVEFVSKLVNSSAVGIAGSCDPTKASESAKGNKEILAPNVQQGSKKLDKKPVRGTADSIKKENGHESEVIKPAVVQPLERKEESCALSVLETISRYFTTYASDQIEKQRNNAYYNFTKAKEDFLKFNSNNADLKIGRTVSSSEALALSQGDEDVTLREVTCLLNQFHQDQKAILSGVGEVLRHSVPRIDNDGLLKSVNKDAATPVNDRNLDVELSASSRDKDQLPAESTGAQKHLHDSVMAPVKESSSVTSTVVTESALGEIVQSHPMRPTRIRRPPSEEKKMRGMAGTLAIIMGTFEPITEEDAKTVENEQTPEFVQTTKCREPELKKAGSVSSEVCGQKTDLVSHLQKSYPSDKKSSVTDLKSSVSYSKSGVSCSKTDGSVPESGYIGSRKNEFGTLMKAADTSQADGDEVFVVQDGVVLRIKRTQVAKNNMECLEDASYSEEAEDYGSGDDDDDGGKYTDDTDSTDSDDESSSDSECDSSEREPDFVDEVGGLCYRLGHSKVEQRHMTWSRRHDTEVSAAAEIDLDVEKLIEDLPQSFEEQPFVGLPADVDVCPEPVDLSVRPKAKFSTSREKSERRNECYNQTEHIFHDFHGDSHGDFKENWESSGAFSGMHGDGYSRGCEDPNEFHEEQRHYQTQAAADYGCHNNQFGNQYSYPEYQTGSYDDQYHQGSGYNGSYGNHQNHHDYTCYKNSPYYQHYLYHMQEAQRLEQKMKDEVFNKQMEMYMHKAYVIQNMCMDQMKQYLHGRKED